MGERGGARGHDLEEGVQVLGLVVKLLGMSMDANYTLSLFIVTGRSLEGVDVD